MRKIKNYQDFTNEEINLKKALTGAALGTSLLFSNPSYTNVNQPFQQTESPMYANLPIDGWDKVKWGMTPDEVKKIYNIKSDDLIIINHKITQYEYDVSFIFNNNKLEEVRLFLKSVNSVDYLSLESREKDETSSDIEQKLESKYGNPSAAGGVCWTGSYHDANVTRWIGKSGKLELVHAFYSINYENTTFKSGITIRYKKIDPAGF